MKTILAAVFASVVLTACGVEGDNGSDVSSQSTDSARRSEFTLYDTPDYKPDGFCDRYTSLKLSNKGMDYAAHLENRLDGICELFVAPNPRDYTLTVSQAGCGSLQYTSVEKGANDLPKLVLVDHSTRLCDDYRPNVVVVKELYNGKYHTMYSARN